VFVLKEIWGKSSDLGFLREGKRNNLKRIEGAEGAGIELLSGFPSSESRFGINRSVEGEFLCMGFLNLGIIFSVHVLMFLVWGTGVLIVVCRCLNIHFLAHYV